MRHISILLHCKMGNCGRSNKTMHRASSQSYSYRRDHLSDGIDTADDPGLYSFDEGGVWIYKFSAIRTYQAPEREEWFPKPC